MTTTPTIDLSKVCRLPQSKGVVIGYQVLVQPITQRDVEVLSTLKECSQDLSPFKADPYDRLCVEEKKRIIHHFCEHGTKYEKYLIEHGFKLRTFMREGFEEGQEG